MRVHQIREEPGLYEQKSREVVELEQGCQTQIYSGPKLKNLTKSRANIDIY